MNVNFLYEHILGNLFTEAIKKTILENSVQEVENTSKDDKTNLAIKLWALSHLNHGTIEYQGKTYNESELFGRVWSALHREGLNVIKTSIEKQLSFNKKRKSINTSSDTYDVLFKVGNDIYNSFYSNDITGGLLYVGGSGIKNIDRLAEIFNGYTNIDEIDDDKVTYFKNLYYKQLYYFTYNYLNTEKDTMKMSSFGDGNSADDYSSNDDNIEDKIDVNNVESDGEFYLRKLMNIFKVFASKNYSDDEERFQLDGELHNYTERIIMICKIIYYNFAEFFEPEFIASLTSVSLYNANKRVGPSGVPISNRLINIVRKHVNQKLIDKYTMPEDGKIYLPKLAMDAEDGKVKKVNFKAINPNGFNDYMRKFWVTINKIYEQNIEDIQHDAHNLTKYTKPKKFRQKYNRYVKKHNNGEQFNVSESIIKNSVNKILKQYLR